MLADLLRSRRRAGGLTLREAARLIGISPGYLSSLEHGRNPTTGRPPTPSPPVLAAIGRTLGIDLGTLLDLAGAAPPPSTHVLLVRLGGDGPSALEGARLAVSADVDQWLEISLPPAATAGALPSALTHHQVGAGGLGLVFGAAARPLAHVADPDDLLAAEETWEHDVARACRDTLGRAPAANVCVYRAEDIRGVRAGDPLAVALALVRTHPRVAAQHDDGDVTTGPAAIEALFRELRPDAIAPATWAQLAGAAARGLGRWAPS